VQPSWARDVWRVLEPYHTVCYFAPEPAAQLKALGLKGFWMGYFAARAAPFGAAGPELVTATFFGFHPAMVRRALPDAWGYADPQATLDARLAGVDAALRRLLGDLVDDPSLDEAADLAARAAHSAAPAGRPLYAATSALPWPEPAHLRLWHAAGLLREYRGDGHIAALTAAGVDGAAAHVLLVAAGLAPRELLQSVRGWDDDDWAAATARMVERGWLGPDGGFTESGRLARERIEQITDECALPPLEVLGDAGTQRLIELATPATARIVDDGGFLVPNPIGLTR